MSGNPAAPDGRSVRLLRPSAAGAQSRSVTTPELPSTRSIRPVVIVATAFPVPTTAGSPYSRQTIAVWLMIPPTSETVAATRPNTGAHDGDVAGQTRMSPGSIDGSSEGWVMTRTGPSTTPGEPAVPRSTPSSESERSHSATVDVVIPQSITVNGSSIVVGGGPSAGGGSHARS